MPKSSHTQSPPHSSPSPSKSPSNATRTSVDNVAKMSEVAVRKKKNADAQAAFRARRANYIATLEETVTSLESVVLQLQDSCRESRTEAAELRQENTRLANQLESLRAECREREKYLRAIWLSKKGADDPHALDDFPPPPPSFNVAFPHQSSSNSALVGPSGSHPSAGAYSGHTTEGLDPRLRSPTHTDYPGSLGPTPYHEGPESAYGDRSPALSFVNHEGEAVAANGQTIDLQRMQKMGHYNVFAVPSAARDTGWASGVGPSTSPGNEAVGQENGSASHSPAYMASPTITAAEMPYGPRYHTMDVHKTVLPSIDTVPYMFGQDRSISPAGSSPHTGSQTSVSSQFHFVMPPDQQERPDADYRRHTAHGPEMMLHGGTADVSAYAVNRRRVSNGPDRPMLGGSSSFRAVEDDRVAADAEGGRGGSSDLRSGGRRARRSTTQSAAASHSSRSPSPSHPPISSTLAVIKAQAFGALRRTRARPKKSTEGAAKMAMEVLEARGIGMGIGTGNSHKRPRLHDDDSI